MKARYTRSARTVRNKMKPFDGVLKRGEPAAGGDVNHSWAMTAMAAMLIFGGSIAAGQAAGSAPKKDSAPAGNAEKGKRLYENYGCYQCHGHAAQGGSAGPRLGPGPIPFVALVAYVRHPSGQMPPYTSKVVSDPELADIYAFLKSVPPPPPVKSLPLLNQ